jgi:hypothetical protein
LKRVGELELARQTKLSRQLRKRAIAERKEKQQKMHERQVVKKKEQEEAREGSRGGGKEGAREEQPELRKMPLEKKSKSQARRGKDKNDTRKKRGNSYL